MKMTLEPTEQFFMAGDVMCRAWEGTLENGASVVALISLVQFRTLAEYDAGGLVSIPAPTPEDQARWAKTILDQR